MRTPRAHGRQPSAPLAVSPPTRARRRQMVPAAASIRPHDRREQRRDLRAVLLASRPRPFARKACGQETSVPLTSPPLLYTSRCRTGPTLDFRRRRGDLPCFFARPSISVGAGRPAVFVAVRAVRPRPVSRPLCFLSPLIFFRKKKKRKQKGTKKKSVLGGGRAGRRGRPAAAAVPEIVAGGADSI